MGLISKLMGGEGQNTGSIRPAATEINYDPGLVTKLKDDHKELVRIYTNIRKAAEHNRFDDIPGLLSNFKLAFQTHIAIENVRFYVYVQQHSSIDTDTSTFVAEVRKAMNGIARDVLKFVDTYLSLPPTPATAVTFSDELGQIGSALTQRVQLEESRLYSLYQP